MVGKTVFTKQHIEDTRKFGLINSPCLRRKYGAMITNEHGSIVALGANVRMGKYCKGKSCIRETASIIHGTQVEVGGEIHAEQAALVKFAPSSPYERRDYHILVAGTDGWGKNLNGKENYPCHVCAMMIKFAGFKTVWLPFDDIAIPVSIDEVLEFYEQSADPIY